MGLVHTSLSPSTADLADVLQRPAAVLHDWYRDDGTRLHVIGECRQRLVVYLQNMPHIMATLASSCSCN